MKFLLFVLCFFIVSYGQVLGIDFGTQFWKASLISPGKNLVIVENSRSGRKSINGIAIQEGVRHFEDDALYKRLKKPHMSYFYLNKLLRSLDFQKPLQNYQYSNGTYFIIHENERISLQQLVGMILRNIKLHASNQAGSDIKDAVLAVPANWGWKSRMALINAANIAELSVLGLINENSAAAINFAISRNDSVPINIGFFNLGSHNLQFSIIQFFGFYDSIKGKNIESFRVLSHVVVEDVGGLHVDRAIADHLSKQFYRLHKLDPRTREKSYVKLLHEAAQAKQTLSANKQTQVYVEGIMDGIDLNLPISRQIIQKLEVFQNLHRHLDQALQKAKITKSEVHSVQMIGGASRIPLISKIVKQHFSGIEVGSHINGDQAMAFGSSLRAANLSIAFRVKQLHFYDGFEENIRCIAKQKNQIIWDQVIFTRDSQHGDKAIIHLNPPENDIEISIFFGSELVKTYLSENITAWKNTYNQTNYNSTTSPNIVLVIVLSTTNIVEITETYLNLTINRTEFKTVDDWIQQDQNQQINVEEHLTPENSSQQNNSHADSDNNPQKLTQTNKTQQSSDGNSTDSSKSKTKKKKLTKRIRVVEQNKIETKKYQVQTQQAFNKYPKFSKEQIQQNQRIVHQFQKHQKYLKQKSKIRNDLESTLYKLKDSYEEPFLVKFSKQAELDNLKKVVSEKLEWLDENAWTAEKDDFEKHFNHVFQAYSPMYNRSIQYSQREKKYNETIQYLSFTYQKTLQMNSTHSWLEDKVVAHLKKINDTVEEIHKRLKEQYERELHEDPIIYNQQMLNMAERLRDEYYFMRMIPRPKIPKTEKKQEQNQEQIKQQNSYQEKFDQKTEPQTKEDTDEKDQNQQERNQHQESRQHAQQASDDKEKTQEQEEKTDDL